MKLTVNKVVQILEKRIKELESLKITAVSKIGPDTTYITLRRIASIDTVLKYNKYLRSIFK